MNDKQNRQSAVSDNLTADDIREMALARFAKVAREKYDKGQAEHQGLITDPERDLLAEIEAEAIDLYFYAFALRLRRKRALAEMGERDEN
jgi:hypothetical protein